MTALTALVLVGCGGEKNDTSDPTPEIDAPEAGVVEHPNQEQIPHADRDAEPITTERSIASHPNPPKQFDALRAFLNDPTSVDTTQLGIFVKEATTVHVTSVGEDRLVLLEGHVGNRLFEYDRRADTTRQIATPGNGPGELRFAMDLTRDGSSVHVARQDQRVERFDCSAAPCTYQSTARVGVNAMSIASRADGYALLAQPSNRGGASASEIEAEGAIRLVDADEAVQDAFGQIYRSDRFLVLSGYARGSDLLRSRRFEKYVLGVEKLPYVWVYDENGEIGTVLKMAEYRPQTLEYDPKDRSLSWSGDRYSETHLLSVVDDRFVLLAVSQIDENGTQVDYYTLDLKTDTPYFLGTDSLGPEVVERLVLVHDQHSVLIENGAVALIEST